MKNLNKIRELLVRFRGLTTIGIATLVSNAISGIFWLYLASLIGAENYGLVSYLLAISGITTVLTFLGSGSTLPVYIAKNVKIQSSLYFVTLISSAVASIILFFLFHNIGVSLFVLGNVIFGLVTYELLGRKSYKKYAAYTIGQKLLMVAMAIGLYYVMKTDGIILGIALSYFLPSVLIYRGFKSGKIDFLLLRSHLGFIVNSYLLDISRSFSGTLDKIIVAPLLGFALLGNYQLGIQFLSLLLILPGVVFQYILPHDAAGTSNKGLKLAVIIFSCILTVSTLFLSPVFVPMLFPKFTEAITAIQIMSLALVPRTINLTYISKLLGQEKSRIAFIGSAIFLSVQISMIVLLSKMFGINGTAFSYVLGAVSETIYLTYTVRGFQRRTEQ